MTQSRKNKEIKDVYHAGEKMIQSLAGRQSEAQALSRMIAPTLSLPSAKFLSSQRFAIASSVDSADRVWASLLMGSPGFLEVLAVQNVYIHCEIAPDSPLSRSIGRNAPLGLVVIDFAHRTRLRLNGKVLESSAAGIALELRQVYFNCPMYIQRRSLQSLTPETEKAAIVTATTSTLSHPQAVFISQSDTFFIASLNSETSDADASHRGGFPGFVKVICPDTIAFPDYSGNNMFNTLGNIHINPHVGLIFIDFERSSMIQLTGEAKILWEPEIVSAFLGAERVILYHIEQVVESLEQPSMQWQFIDYSPHNPALQISKVPHESEQFVPPLSNEIIEKMLKSFAS